MKIAAILLVAVHCVFGFPGYSNNFNDPCPAFTDFASSQSLSYNATGYPQTAIDAELAAKSPSLDCVLRVPGTEPSLPHDPALNYAQQSCPSHTAQLRRFVRTSATCWIVNELQEPVYFTICKTKSCQICGGQSNTGVQARCAPHYEYHNVWVFCEDRTVGDQITKELVITPVSCSCLKVQCNTSHSNSNYNPFGSFGWK